MDAVVDRQWPSRAVALALLLAICIPGSAVAAGVAGQVCDVGADYSLGTEDYPEAIRLHLRVVREHPENALAHYHLGFAEGMVGNQTAELSEYRQAEALGLRSWDLFLNMGLARLQEGEVDAAETSLRQAVLLGPEHPESHFNLALAYHRGEMFAAAEHEVLASLQLDPSQPDARNLLGVIYAERGERARARSVWQKLLQDVPGFSPARTNLVVLGGSTPAAAGKTAAATPTRRPPSKLLTDSTRVGPDTSSGPRSCRSRVRRAPAWPSKLV